MLMGRAAFGGALRAVCQLSTAPCRRPLLRLCVARCSSSTSSNPLSTRLVPLSSIPKEELGESIMLMQENLPPGSPKTTHDIISKGVFIAKVLSLSSSAVGVAMVPVLSSYLWEAASERPSMMAFAIVANGFLVLLSFTPVLLHFLAKRFPVNVYYNKQTKTVTTVHYDFFLRKRALRFRPDDVVDAQVAPEMKKVWIPLATAFVHGRPLLLSLDRNAYSDWVAFHEVTKRIEIPPNHD